MNRPRSQVLDETTERAYDEAAAWQVKFHNGEADESDRDFIDWLAASPAHRAAMDRAQTVWCHFGAHAASPEMVRGRRDALHRSGQAAARRWSQFQATSPLLKLLAAAALFALTITPVIFFAAQPKWLIAAQTAPAPVVFETAIGESRIVTLEDNSRVTLDAASRLNVAYTPAGRDIMLERGQAYFEVAKDTSRPFRVTAGNQVVLATGTQFNVELVGDEVFVTLLEGSVVVSETAPASDGPGSEDSSSAIRLKEGEQLGALAGARPQIAPGADVRKVNAWRDGKVFLEGDTLAEAVERMNRYSRIRLSVAGPDLDAYRISGAFNAGDTDAFVDAIESYFPVEARRVSSNEIEIHARP